MSFTTLKNAKELKVRFCKQQADPLLVDLESLIEWSIVPANFPLPQDPREKLESIRIVSEKSDSVKLVDIEERQGSFSSKLSFWKINKDTFGMDAEISKLKKILLSMF